MINNLNNTDCCTTPTNLVEIMEHTHIKGAGLYQCRKCHHADFYPRELFIKVPSKTEEPAPGETKSEDGLGVEGK